MTTPERAGSLATILVRPAAATTTHDSTSAEPGGEHRGRWAWVGIVTLLAILISLYWIIALGLIADWWEDPNYSHGFLVPFFSGVLVWRRRKQFASIAPNGTWVGLLVLFSGICALALGNIGGEDFLMRSSLVIILAGLVLFHFGHSAFRLLAFPLAFLFFMVPLPQILFNGITFPLQSAAASSAAYALDGLGIPVLLDGHVIHLSQISLGVTEACSGIRSLISLLALAVAWAHLTLRGVWRPIVLVAAALPITLLANAGRVIATGLIGEWFGVEYAEGFFHGLAGWLIFVVAFLCLYTVYRAIRRTVTKEEPV